MSLKNIIKTTHMSNTLKSKISGHITSLHNRKQVTGLLSTALLTMIAMLFLLPDRALAVQVHGPPEGLYVHNMAHVFFSAALIFLLYILYRYPVGHGPAWRYLKTSFILFLLWNIDTLSVHILSVRLPADAITRNPDIWQRYLRAPISLERWFFYMGSFDHLLCVPAIFFLVLSLKHFCKETEKKITSKKAGT